MDRRARKIEQKRKQRELKKKQSRSELATRSDPNLVRVAAGAPFGACYLSAGWDDLEEPKLVTAIVTRTLSGGRVVAGVALVDRTCMGIKNGFVTEPMRGSEVDRFVVLTGKPHDGMELCEQATVQSVVFHAIDYAEKLGLKPHRDFPGLLFGPRPETLVDTPWSARPKPLYVEGLDEDADEVVQKLTTAVGKGNFDHVALG